MNWEIISLKQNEYIIEEKDNKYNSLYTELESQNRESILTLKKIISRLIFYSTAIITLTVILIKVSKIYREGSSFEPLVALFMFFCFVLPLFLIIFGRAFYLIEFKKKKETPKRWP